MVSYKKLSSVDTNPHHAKKQKSAWWFEKKHSEKLWQANADSEHNDLQANTYRDSNL